jgi:hypothetical protein
MSFFQSLFGQQEAQNAHRQVYGDGGNDYQGGNQGEHQSSFTHEAIAGAAGFAGIFRNICLVNCILNAHVFLKSVVALKAYEDHVRSSGEQVSHPMMKEMLAGFAAAEVDKLFETKGLDYLDREKAKRMAI